METLQPFTHSAFVAAGFSPAFSFQGVARLKAASTNGVVIGLTSSERSRQLIENHLVSIPDAELKSSLTCHNFVHGSQNQPAL
jgi:hypothetical protein